jgi:hypothetical protein
MDVLPSRALKKIDIADCPELTREPFQFCGFCLGIGFSAARQKAMQRHFDRAVFFVTRPIKKRNQFLIWHLLDLLNSNQRRVTIEISNLLRQPLKMLVLRRIVGQEIGRCFDLDCADFFKPPPDRHAFRLLPGGKAVKEEKPGSCLHAISAYNEIRIARRPCAYIQLAIPMRNTFAPKDPNKQEANKYNSMKQILTAGVIFAASIYASLAADLNTARIDELTGLKGKMNEKEGVYRVTFPRNDVKVVVDGWTMPPFMGLGTWAAFTKGAHTEAMVMGDSVLFEDEVNPAISVALENGLSVTALHNHFLFDQPKVYFMHIEGQGTTEQLAGAVRKVYDRVKEIRTANPQPKDSFGAIALPEKNSISAEPLNKVFGRSGEANNGMVKFTIGHPATMHGVKIDNAMGVNTWMAFAGTDNNAVVDGDFAVTEDELQSALKAIRVGGINIVAIHSHMTHEQPRILFFHYWGRGPAKKLGEAIQGAILASGLSGVSTSAAK